MAKLARLMQPGPPQFIEPERLADSGETLAGELSLEGMTRLQALLAETGGLIHYRLSCGRDQRYRLRLGGEYRATLIMNCQRCLKPVEVSIKRAIDVTLIAKEEEALELAAETEPLLKEGRTLSVARFFEDELLLALPLAANHDTRECHRQEESTQTESDRQLPFTILKDLKLKKNS